MLYEKCGIVGIYSPTLFHMLPHALTAAGGVQHRGQQGTGIAIKTKEKIITYKSNGLIKQVFSTNIINRLDKPADWVLVHCRYGTYGNYARANLQPCIVKTKDNDTLAVIHNGEFAATNDFISVLKNKTKKRLKKGLSDTYLFSLVLGLSQGVNWDEKIINCLKNVKGAYSLIIGVNGSIYLARDKFGIRPLIFGKIKDGYLAASETHAFSKIGATVTREVGKGEIVRIDKRGPVSIQKESGRKSHFCDFEWAYFSRPESRYPTTGQQNNKKPSEWLSVSLFRERSGAILASEHPFPEASFVVGIPDSGISLGTGYANTLRLPYRQAVVRDHFDRNGQDRLFMRDDEMRKISKKVLGKLSLIIDARIWKEAVVVVADDSIVRGNVSSEVTRAIFSMGAKEVHWIIGFPAIAHKCHLGVSIRSGEELIATRHKSDPVKIAKELGATSIYYISNIGFIKARLLGKKFVNTTDPKKAFLENGGCGGCITGLYPVTQDGVEYEKSS
ncbi:hypothetical protein HYT02_01850 [Candidatus Gottesmanbacteria bacterium]|nr:hypothetical protein [Candidatus Gottesmanbacteria bacterium]